MCVCVGAPRVIRKRASESPPLSRGGAFGRRRRCRRHDGSEHRVVCISLASKVAVSKSPKPPLHRRNGRAGRLARCFGYFSSIPDVWLWGRRARPCCGAANAQLGRRVGQIQMMTGGPSWSLSATFPPERGQHLLREWGWARRGSHVRHTDLVEVEGGWQLACGVASTRGERKASRRRLENGGIHRIASRLLLSERGGGVDVDVLEGVLATRLSSRRAPTATLDLGRESRRGGEGRLYMSSTMWWAWERFSPGDSERKSCTLGMAWHHHHTCARTHTPYASQNRQPFPANVERAPLAARGTDRSPADMRTVRALHVLQKGPGPALCRPAWISKVHYTEPRGLATVDSVTRYFAARSQDYVWRESARAQARPPDSGARALAIFPCCFWSPMPGTNVCGRRRVRWRRRDCDRVYPRFRAILSSGLLMPTPTPPK
jgi:hypothetical protein